MYFELQKRIVNTKGKKSLNFQLRESDGPIF